MNDLRKNQLGILQEILFNQRNVHKFVPKNHTVRSELIWFSFFNRILLGTKCKKPQSKVNTIVNRDDIPNYLYRPASAKNLNTFDCNRSVHSAGEEVPTNGPARVSRSSKRDNRLQAYRMPRSQSHHYSIPARSATNVSFVSDNSNLDPSPGQFKKVDNRLKHHLKIGF